MQEAQLPELLLRRPIRRRRGRDHAASWYGRPASGERAGTATDPDGGRPGLLPVAVVTSEVEGVAVPLPGPSSGPGHRSALTNESGPAAAEWVNDEGEHHGQHGYPEQPDAGLDSIEHPDGLRLPARPGVPFARRSRSGAGGYAPKSHPPSRTKVPVPLGQCALAPSPSPARGRPTGSEDLEDIATQRTVEWAPNKPIIRRARPTPSFWPDRHRPNERKMSPRCVSPEPP